MTPSAPLARLAPVAILALTLSLGALYSVTTPIFEAPDEFWHWHYVNQLAGGRGLPRPDRDPVSNPARQEATQPPLYYALGALATFWVDTGAPDHLYLPNPHARIGQPAAADNRNAVVHSPDEAFPWRGVPLAVHLVRLVSLALGALTVLTTYLIGRELVPHRPALAIGGALVNALVPQFLFVAGSINNDTLVTLLCSTTLLLLVRILQPEREPSPRQVLALGVSAGLAALAKPSGLALLPVIGLALLWLAIRRRALASLVVRSVLAFGSAALVAGWWYVRNWALYGDPALLGRHLAIVGGRPEPVGLLDVLLREGQGLRWSFWGVFGWFNVVAAQEVYLFYDAATALALLGLGLALARRPGWSPSIALLAVWCALLFGLLLKWSQTTMASQGRLLFPAIAPISLALFAGWSSLAPGWRPGRVLALAGAPLLALAVALPLAYIAPAYAAPPVSPPGTARALLGAGTVDVSYDDEFMLVGLRFADERLVAGRPAEIDLYWRALAPMARNYSVYAHLYDGAGQLVGQRDTYPGGGAYATSRLQPGDELRGRLTVPVSAAARPGPGHLDVGLYEYPAGSPLKAYDGARRLLRNPNVASFRVFAAEPAPGPPAWPASGRYGEGLVLVGWRLNAAGARPGGQVTGGLYWRAAARPRADYTVFVHVARPGMPPVAQADAQVQGGGYPTSLWRPGDEVYHPFAIGLPEDTPPGEYELLVGLYDQPTGRRLEISPEGAERLARSLRGLLGRGGTPETAARLTTLAVR